MLEVASAAPSWREVQRASRVTHTMFLTLNDQIARAGPCFSGQIARWRQVRGAWARFYSEGWSESRYDAMLAFRLLVLRWRKLLMGACALAARELPLLALR